VTRAAAASAAPAPPAGQRRPQPPPRGRELRSGAAPRRRRRQPPPAAALPLRLVRGPAGRAARARAAGVLDALLSGRAWIALIGVLLAGIVFLNVDLLQRGRRIAATAERSAELTRENARLRSELGELGSAERIQEAAAQQGMVLPLPGDVRYVRARPARDARLAARRTSAPTYTAAPAARSQELFAEPADGALATAPFGAATGATTGAGAGSATGAGSVAGAGVGSTPAAGAGAAAGAGSATGGQAAAAAAPGSQAVAPPAAVAGAPR
jgi:cell division protein FtsL